MAEPATPILTDEELLLVSSFASEFIRAIGAPTPKQAVDELISNGTLGAYAKLKGRSFDKMPSRDAKKKYYKYSQTKGVRGRQYMSSDVRDVLLFLVLGLTHTNGLKEKFTYATRWLQALELFGFGEGKNFPAELKKVQAEFAPQIEKYRDRLRNSVVFSGPIPGADSVPATTGGDGGAVDQTVIVTDPAADTLGGSGPTRQVTGADLFVPPDPADPAAIVPDPADAADPFPTPDPDVAPLPDPPALDPVPEPEPEPLSPAPMRRQPKRRRKVWGRLVKVGLPLLLVTALVLQLFEIPAISNLQQRLPFKTPVPASFWGTIAPSKIVERVTGDPESTDDVDWSKADALGKRVEARVSRLAEVRKALAAAKEEYKAESYRKRLGQLYDGPYKADVDTWLEYERKATDEYASLDSKSTEIAELRAKIESKTARRSEIQQLIDIEKGLCGVMGIEWRANATPLPSEGDHATKGALGQLNRVNRLRGLITVSPPRDSDRTIEAILAEKK